MLLICGSGRRSMLAAESLAAQGYADLYSVAGGFTRWQAEELLHTLERKEFVQRSRSSSVGSELEYAFRHLFIRDVAYGQKHTVQASPPVRVQSTDGAVKVTVDGQDRGRMGPAGRPATQTYVGRR